MCVCVSIKSDKHFSGAIGALLHCYSAYCWQCYCYYYYFCPSIHPSFVCALLCNNFSFQFHFTCFERTHLFVLAFSSSSSSLHSDSTVAIFVCINGFSLMPIASPTSWPATPLFVCIHEYGKFNYLIKISSRYFNDIVHNLKKNKKTTRQQTYNLRFGTWIYFISMPCNRLVAVVTINSM